MSEYMLIKKESLTAMADAVRESTGETSLYSLNDMYEKLWPGFIFMLTRDDWETHQDHYNLSDYKISSIPNDVTKIRNYAFRGCRNLALTSLPEGVTSIGDDAFLGCDNLALTYLPESITEIGEEAFYDSDGLTELTFKGTPTKIASNAFEYCDNLITINVPWAEGEVANAPWGATNATVNYNYTGE